MLILDTTIENVCTLSEREIGIIVNDIFEKSPKGGFLWYMRGGAKYGSVDEKGK